VAILSTDAKKIFGSNIAFDYHAIYYHLTRMGVPPAMVSERDVAAKGVPQGFKVLLVVQEQDPLNAATLEAIKTFQKNGGKVVQLGENAVQIEGAMVVAEKVRNIWDLTGFM